MSHEIIPAILEKSFDQIEARVSSVAGFAAWVQLDVCDGIFVPSYSWPYEDHTSEDDDGESAGDIDSLEQLSPTVSCEVHLMIVNPEEMLHEWLARPEVKRILIHPESTLRLEHCLQVIKESGKEAGVSLCIDTPVEVIVKVAHLLDRIQVMGIEGIGKQGELLDARAVIKVRELREQNLGVTLSIDGGVTLENAAALFATGTDALVVGSALFRSENVKQTYEYLLNAQPARGDN